jgi:hypothetical protein
MPAKFCGRVIRGCRVALLLVAAAAAFGPATGQAFTLIPMVKLYVNPAAGYTTSLVQVHATLNVGTCSAAPATFKFLFDSKPLWTKTVNCNPNTVLWDTGWSPYIKPPVPPTVGKHVISVTAYSTTGAPIGTANYSYSIYPAPASPRTQPTPSQVATPSQDCATGAVGAACASPTTATSPGCPAAAVTAVCSSPSAKACPAAMLPNAGTGGWGDNTIAALMVGSALPIAGLALFGPGPLWAFARRRRTVLVILGLSMLVTLTVSCDFPGIQGSTPSPSASASTISCLAA